jgi:hypothetical protein
MSENESARTAGMAMFGPADFSKLDDSTLLSKRAEMRAELNGCR